MSTFTEHPPVPQVLQEALKDYPELIAQLEEGLRTVGRSPGMSKAQLTDQLEAATWVLEAALEHATVLAARDARAADSSGNAEQIHEAQTKLRLLDRCYQVDRRDGKSELLVFFE